jgi:hypothetical protein
MKILPLPQPETAAAAIAPAPDREGALPPMIDGADWLEEPDEEIPELIAGILHQGMKMTLGGASKSNKTWCLVDMAVSVATGADWWGFPTTKRRVVYVNFEVPGAFFKKRLRAVLSAKNLTLEPGQWRSWNLRGHSAPLAMLAPKIISAVQELGDAGLLVLDPLYKLMAGQDENSAGDLGLLCLELDRLATQTGAAVAYGAHFSKGNQAAKESIDRISGSGVMARDPDSILTMTAHEEPGALTVEPVLRNHPPIEPFVIRWNYPLMCRTDDLDPAKLKRVKKGFSKVYNVDQIINQMGDQEWTTGNLQKHMSVEKGMSSATFYKLWGEAQATKRVHESPLKKKGKIPRWSTTQ